MSSHDEEWNGVLKKKKMETKLQKVILNPKPRTQQRLSRGTEPETSGWDGKAGAGGTKSVAGWRVATSGREPETSICAGRARLLVRGNYAVVFRTLSCKNKVREGVRVSRVQDTRWFAFSHRLLPIDRRELRFAWERLHHQLLNSFVAYSTVYDICHIIYERHIESRGQVSVVLLSIVSS